MVDVRTVVNENQQTRHGWTYNVNTIFHPVDAASRAILKISPKC